MYKKDQMSDEVYGEIKYGFLIFRLLFSTLLCFGMKIAT